MKLTLISLFTLMAFGFSLADDASICSALEAADSQIAMAFKAFPIFATMKLGESAKKFCSEAAYNAIKNSDYEDKTLQELLDGLKSPENFDTMRKDFFSSKLGAMTINQIFSQSDQEEQQGAQKLMAKMLKTDEYGDIPLNQLEKINC